MKLSNRRQLSADVQVRLTRGESKSEIYNALKTSYSAASVERSLAQWPTPEAKAKNKYINITLLILAVFFTLLTLLLAISAYQTLEPASRIPALPILALPVLLFAYVIYGIKNYNLFGYLLIILFSAQHIFNIARMGINTSNDAMLLALSLVAIVLGILQKKRLFPNTSWVLRHKRDDSGNPIF